MIAEQGLYYEAGLVVIEVTSGLIPGFQSYKTGSILSRGASPW